MTATLRPDTEVQSPHAKQRCRGLSIFVTHRLLKVFFISRFSKSGSDLGKCFLLNVMAELLLLNVKVANVHAILSGTTGITYRYFFSWSTWLSTFSATLLYSVASSLCFYLPAYQIKLLGAWEGRSAVSEEMQFASVVATIAILYFGTVVPAYAVFIRVAASAQGGGSLDIKTAWQSFPWSARLHFFKLLAEVLALEIGVCMGLSLFVLATFHPELHDNILQYFMEYAG